MGNGLHEANNRLKGAFLDFTPALRDMLALKQQSYLWFGQSYVQYETITLKMSSLCHQRRVEVFTLNCNPVGLKDKGIYPEYQSKRCFLLKLSLLH